jgi:site-specific recombinase XerC
METTVKAPLGLLTGHPTDNAAGPPRADRLAQQWLAWLRDVRGLSDNSVAGYTTVLTAWLAWCDLFAPHDPLRPSLGDLESFTARPLANGGRRSPATRRVECSCLRGWFGWLVKRRLVEHDPTAQLEAPKGQGRKRRPVPDEHWQPLWAAAWSAVGRDSACTGTRTYLGLGLAMFCGLRLSEIGQLTGRHVHGDTLQGLIRKGGKECDVPWLEMVTYHAEHPALSHLLPEPSQFVTLLTDVARAKGNERMFWQRPVLSRDMGDTYVAGHG